MIFIFAIFTILPSIVSGCARTADSGTVVTTVAPGVTTTVPGATTTAANCNSCMASQLTLSAEPGEDPTLSHAPDTPTAGQPLNGCSTLILTCTPLAGQAQSLMTFNNGIGGPPPGNPATGTLVCNTQGQYQLGDVNGPEINAVYCFG